MMCHDFKSPLLPLFQRGKLLAMPPWAAQGFIGPFEGLTQ